MARIPTYQRSEQPRAVDSRPNAQSVVSANSPIANGLQDVGRSIMGAAEDFAERQRQERENLAAVDVSNVLSNADTYWQENTTNRFKAYKVGDPDLRESLNADFDKWKDDTRSKLQTDKARQYFDVHANKLKNGLLQGALQYQEKATTAKLNADTVVGQQEDENAIYRDGSRFNDVYTRRAETVLARTDLSEGEKISTLDKMKRQYSLAAERGEMERDPGGWYERRFGQYRMGPGGMPASGGGYSSQGSMAVARAIYGQESSSGAADTSGVNAQNVTGPMQMQEGTFEGMKRLGLIPAGYDWKNPEQNKDAGFKWVDYLSRKYNGDPAKVAAAYYGGEKAVGPDGTIKRDMKNLQRPNDPTVGQYVDQVLKRMGRPGDIQVASADTSAGLGISTAPDIVQPKTFVAMDWEQQSALRQMAETRLKQSEAMFKADAERIVRDATAMHADGIQDTFNLTRQYFDRAYGIDGERMFTEYQRSRDMAADIGLFKTQSETEIRAELETDRPKGGAGYAAEDARYTQRVKAATLVLEQRKQDPAGYATRNSETLTAQRQQIDGMQPNDPNRAEVVQKFTRDNLAEQRRLGIQNPQVLTPAQADAIAAQAMKATRPEDSANLIAGLEAEYGQEFFPKVLDQLVRENKVSGELLIIPNLPSPAARELVSRMARIKESDLTAGIDTSGQKEVKDAITDRLEGFAKAVPAMTAQAASVTNTYETTMRKIAYQMVQGGAKPKDAAEQAYNLVLGHYEFDGTTRFPKTVDVSSAKRGAEHALQADLGGIDVPFDLTGSRKPEEARAEWERTVRARPQWYTRDDDGGLELWAMGNNGVRYRVTRGGQQVSYSWTELAMQNRAGIEASKHGGQGIRAKMRDANEAARARIAETRRQVENEDMGNR